MTLNQTSTTDQISLIKKQLNEKLKYAMGSAGEASCYEDIYRKCKNLPNTPERNDYLEELKTKKRELTKDIKTGVVSSKIDIAPYISSTLVKIEGKSFPEAIRVFINLKLPEENKRTPSILNHVYVKDMDRDGNFGKGGYGLDITDSYKKHIFVEGMLFPAMWKILSEHSDLNLFRTEVENSPLVSKRRVNLITAGIVRFFNLELYEASHILILQIEDSLRCLLENAGIDTTTEKPMKGYTHYKKLTLDAMLGNSEGSSLFRKKLESELGVSVISEIENLFSNRGLNLRNDFAHGNIPDGEIHLDNIANHNTVYACWFIVKLIFNGFDSNSRLNLNQ